MSVSCTLAVLRSLTQRFNLSRAHGVWDTASVYQFISEDIKKLQIESLMNEHRARCASIPIKGASVPMTCATLQTCGYVHHQKLSDPHCLGFYGGSITQA